MTYGKYLVYFRCERSDPEVLVRAPPRQTLHRGGDPAPVVAGRSGIGRLNGSWRKCMKQLNSRIITSM